jgi:hypothetical protein
MANFSLIISIVAVAAVFAVIIATFLGCSYLRRRRTEASSSGLKVEYVPNELEAAKASSPDLKVEPVPNKLEASVSKVINTQPEPNNEGIKEPSDEDALSLSTTTDLPTTPIGVYVRVLMPSFRSCELIPFLALLGSEQCSQVARAPRRSVYEGRLFQGNIWTVSRHRKHPHAGLHASLVPLVATRT